MAWLWGMVVAVLAKCLSVLCQSDQAQQITLKYSIVEEIGSSTMVGDVLVDADLEQKYSHLDVKSLEFTFLNPPVLPFSLGKFSGKIQTTERIDRDGICAGLNKCIQKMDVVVRPMFEIIKVSIQILDLNDNRPIFHESDLLYQMLESAAPGTNIVLPTATDPDSGVFGIQLYELLPVSDTFELKVKDKVDGTKDVRLVLAGKLDREKQPFYHMKILAFDGGNPPKSGSMAFTIQIQDANDNDPVFDLETYEITVPENAPIQTTILRVHASDPDSGSYGEVLYRFSEHTRADLGHMFSIVNTTGEIYVSGVIDYEEGSVYHLSVMAQDKGPDSVPSDTTVIVHVIDINDHSPQITVNTLGIGGEDIARISEAAGSGIFVAHITVVDPDEGQNAKFVCDLNEKMFQLQRLNLGQYKIVTNGSLDREQRSRYSLAITCIDNGAEPQVSIKHIQVFVMDINDNAPVFKQDQYTGYVNENNFVGVYITSVSAVDLDSGSNAEIEYKLQRDVRDLFLINPKTGSITAQTVFDREDFELVRFRVLAVDRGSPRLTGTATVVVHITDINDENPTFTRTAFSFGVFENEPNVTEVGTVTATDADDEPNNRFLYKLLPGEQDSDKFTIDPHTGKLCTTVTLDREAMSMYHITVVAEDEGVPYMSGTATVTIYVADRNDNTPIIDFPSSSNNTVHMPSKVPESYLVTKIKAHDLDVDRNANLTYELVHGRHEKIFKMEPRTGFLRVKEKLDEPEQQTYEIQIKVKDHGVPSKYAVATLHVVVNHSIIYSFQSSESALHGNNFTIVITMACVSVVIAVVLIVAVVLLRRQDRERKSRKYNCRMEALKVLHSSTDNSKDDESKYDCNDLGRNMTNASCLSSRGNERPRKEVSFSLDMDDAEQDDLDTEKTIKTWPPALDHHMQILHAGGALSPEVEDHYSTPPGEQSRHQPHRPLTQKELEVHQLYHMLKRDQDADSAYSADGSNTDSGHGPSEEGEAGPHRHNNHGGAGAHLVHPHRPDNHPPPAPSFRDHVDANYNPSSHSYSSHPAHPLQTFAHSRHQAAPDSPHYVTLPRHIPQRPNRGILHGPSSTARVAPSSHYSSQTTCATNLPYESLSPSYHKLRGYNSEADIPGTHASVDDGAVYYSVNEDSIHLKGQRSRDQKDQDVKEKASTSGSFVTNSPGITHDIEDQFFKDLTV